MSSISIPSNVPIFKTYLKYISELLAFHSILKDGMSESKNITFVFYKRRIFFVKDFYIHVEIKTIWKAWPCRLYLFFCSCELHMCLHQQNINCNLLFLFLMCFKGSFQPHIGMIVAQLCLRWQCWPFDNRSNFAKVISLESKSESEI